ncbi:MAG: hypothetical protein ACERKK_08710 [Poseidonibacter sp.]|uniref:hypothetical protein n=1 Tax=Poseidonibacter sp. TaxID=2321188 RepID=UPI00359DC04E
MQTNKNEYIHHLENICSDYNMNASDVYNILISKNDSEFPLSFETVKDKVLKDVPLDILKKIFTITELKTIFSDTNTKKIKNPQTRKFINSLN